MGAPDVDQGQLLRPEEWRRAQKLTYAELADRLECDESTARRQCLGLQDPDRKTKALWLRFTRGEVQPNHFLGLPGVHPAEALRALARTERAA